MSLLDRVREALEGYRYVTETSALGGVVFEWGGDPLVGVVDEQVIVRVPGGWESVSGDIDDLISGSADVVIAECVVRWHADLRAGDHDKGSDAMLGLVHHEPDRVLLQRLLLEHTHHAYFGYLATVCLGHVGRLDGEVLPEVVPRLRELLDDPALGGTAENALQDIESYRGRGQLSG